MTLALSGTEPKGFKLYNMQRQSHKKKKKKKKKKLAIAIPQHFLCLLLVIPAFSYRQDYALLVIISDNSFCHLYPGV